MEPSQAPYEALIAKHLSGTLSPAEKDELERWLAEDTQHQQLLQQLEAVWAQTGAYGTHVNPDIKKDWKKLESRLALENGHTTLKGKTKVFKMFSATRVAAAVLVVTVLSWFLYNSITQPQMIEVAALHGETKEVKLPDGSVIWLNENSSIRYPEDMNTAGQRKVSLAGEAFFEVTKKEGKPFIVAALETKTEVLGTSFNILARKEKETIIVSVVTGKVRFSKKEIKEQLYLEAGTAGIYTRTGHQLQKTETKNQNFLSWKSGQLQFNNTTLQEVLDDLGRHYGVQFVLQDQRLADKRITTSFGKEPLEEVLPVLQTLLDVQIVKDGNRYRVQ
ncbi:MAG: FecR family protein [Chitinophagaceae bacterium]